MSILLYAEPSRASITKIDINGQGREARLDPGTPLTIKGELMVQNPKMNPTDEVQVILFLEDQFLKCVYNDIPALAPDYTVQSFEVKYTVPAQGKYRIRMGWGYNWPWPEDAYNFLMANPENVTDVGVLYSGPVKLALPSLVPAVAVLVSVGIVIGTMMLPKK